MTPAPVSREDLMGLARQFVGTVGQRMKEADSYLAGMDPEEIRVQPAFDTLADGEPLILQLSLLKAGQMRSLGVRIDQPVNVVKQGHDVMISMSDFTSIATFPIRVDARDGKADGWFIRPDQTFHLDMKTRKVKVKDKIFDIAAEDVLMQDEDILIKGKTLAKWFDFHLIADLGTQILYITTVQEWPAQEKADRLARGANHDTNPEPQQPFLKEPYREIASVPSADISIRQTVSRPPTGPGRKDTTFSMQTVGDLFGYSATSTSNGNIKTGLNDVHLAFSRSSDKPDLLGPLKARFYEFNDVSTVNVPFAGSSALERGVHVTNKDPYTTYDTTTEVTGNAPPGWDVELYRDESYIGGGTVGPDGRYDFTKVTLFVGANKFRIIKYGPQGEIQTEEKTVSVTPNAFGGGGLYNVALTQQNTQTYTKSPSTDKDRGTPHLSATWERQFTDTIALQSGLQVRQENGHENAYLHSGAVAVLKDTVLNVDSVQSARGPSLTALTARQRLGLQNGSISLQHSTKNYAPDATGTPTPALTTLSAEATGPLSNHSGSMTTYAVSAAAVKNGNGVSSLTSALNLSTRVGTILASNIISYETTKVPPPGISSGPRMLDTLSFRGRAFGLLWRTSGSYQISPDNRMDQYALNLSRYFSPTTQGEFNLRHDFTGGYTVGNLSVNYILDRAIVSPTASYDSNHALSMALNVRFGLSRNPYNNDIQMTRQSLQDKGGVSALVFLDKDGDDVFSPGDEMLEDATVEAVQDQIRVETDKNGEAFLYNLPVSRITDIVVQESSAFEANWLSGSPGVSLRPRAGHVTRVVFPIHRGGEMDGTAYITSREAGSTPRALRDMHLRLYDGDGKAVLTAATASDGYYLFERIPPGHYWLIADAEDAKASHVVRPMPLQVDISFKGDVLAGNDMLFEQGENDAGLSVAPDLSDWLAANPALNVRAPGAGAIVLNLGENHSRLLAALMWYKLKTFHGDLVADMQPVVKPADSNPSARTGTGALRLLMPQGTTVQAAYRRCRGINAAGFSCTVELLTKGLQPRQAAAGTASKG